MIPVPHHHIWDKYAALQLRTHEVQHKPARNMLRYMFYQSMVTLYQQLDLSWNFRRDLDYFELYCSILSYGGYEKINKEIWDSLSRNNQVSELSSIYAESLLVFELFDAKNVAFLEVKSHMAIIVDSGTQCSSKKLIRSIGNSSTLAASSCGKQSRRIKAKKNDRDGKNDTTLKSVITDDSASINSNPKSVQDAEGNYQSMLDGILLQKQRKFEEIKCQARKYRSAQRDCLAREVATRYASPSLSGKVGTRSDTLNVKLSRHLTELLFIFRGRRSRGNATMIVLPKPLFSVDYRYTVVPIDHSFWSPDDPVIRFAPYSDDSEVILQKLDYLQENDLVVEDKNREETQFVERFDQVGLTLLESIQRRQLASVSGNGAVSSLWQFLTTNCPVQGLSSETDLIRYLELGGAALSKETPSMGPPEPAAVPANDASFSERFCRVCFIYDCHAHEVPICNDIANNFDLNLGVLSDIACQTLECWRTFNHALAVDREEGEKRWRKVLPLVLEKDLLPSQQSILQKVQDCLFPEAACAIARAFHVPCCRVFKYLCSIQSAKSFDDVVKRHKSFLRGPLKTIDRVGLYNRQQLYGNRDVPSFTPCHHDGPCANSPDCTCFQRGLFCEKYCSCPGTCRDRFPGCSSTCKQSCEPQSCLCIRLRRVCDPEVCSRDDDHEHCANRGLEEWRKLVRIGRSNIHGFGLFARAQVNPDTHLVEYKGELITDSEAERRGVIYDAFHSSYLFDVEDSMVIDGARFGNNSRFMNHSSNPNCFCQQLFVLHTNKVGLVSDIAVEPGKELFFDYNYDDAHKHFVEKPSESDKIQPKKRPRPRVDSKKSSKDPNRSRSNAKRRR